MIIPFSWIIIGYKPLPGEPDYSTAPFLKDRVVPFLISQDKTMDPCVAAQDLSQQLAGKKVCVLIPGQQFDKQGTRHGRGGGWYDRFLAAVPADWLRVGIARKEQLSENTLTRESWDQPVDWILVIDGVSWQAYETCAREQ